MLNPMPERLVDTFPRLIEWLGSACIALLALVVVAAPAMAEKGKLRERLTPEVMAVFYPGAERLGPEEGTPPAIAVYQGDRVVAYVFSTLDIVAATGYSTTPFDVIGGVDLDGRVTGAKVVFHNENYIVHDTVRQRLLVTVLAREAGRPVRGTPASALPPDFVAGATISARAMRAAVLATAGLVLRARTRTAVTVPTLEVESYSPKSFDELLAEGALVRRRVTSGEVAAALAAANASNVRLEVPLRKPEDIYIELVTGLFTPAAIGANLIGVPKFEDYKREMPSGSQAVFIASTGPYDILGTKYFRASEGFRLDRLRVVQDGQTFGFVQDNYNYAAGFRGYQNAGVFALPAGSSFDPVKPRRLELLVHGTRAGAAPTTVAFELDYKVPDALVLLPSAPESEEAQVAPWVEAWSDSRVNVAILAALLCVLTLIFIFQATLARFRLAHRLVRNGFLLVVLVWLGWIAGAQLSIVHVMNYTLAPFKHFDIGFYLAEPLMVIIAVYTLISLLLIGRGVFCGWLCPFGALQELLGQLSRALRVPQWNPSAALEKRLWMGKYIAAAAVLALVMTEIDPSGATIEIEPFKTAITSKFTRAWPYLLYAGALLAVGLFSDRAYSRVLCPLGGVLAFLDRLHLINLLKRRPECGSPCHLCERSCPVRAIEPTGKINTAECLQCLDCPVEYYDAKRCPTLAWAAKLRADAKPVAVMAQNA